MADEKIGLELDIKDGNGRQTLRNLKQEIQELRGQLLSAEKGTEQFNKALSQLKDKEETMRNMRETLAGLDPGKKAQQFVAFGQTIAGGFAAAQGAAALFGTENEEIAKTIVKIQAATSILMGLQSLADAQKQAGLIKNLFLVKSSVAATEAQTAATGKLSIATRILNAIMKLNPFGIILLSITGLVAIISVLYNKFGIVKDAVNALFSPFKALLQYFGFIESDSVKAMNAAIKANEEYIASLEKTIANTKRLRDQNLKILELSGAGEKKILDQSVENNRQSQKENLRLQWANYSQITTLTKLFYQTTDEDRKKEILQEINDLKQKNSDLKYEYTGYNITNLETTKTYNDKIREQNKKASDDEKQRLEKLRDEAQKQAEFRVKLADEEQQRQDNEYKRREDALDRLHEYNDKVKQSKLDALKQQQEDAREDAKVREDIEKEVQQAKLSALSSGFEALSEIGGAFIKNETDRAKFQVAIETAKSLSATIAGAAAAAAAGGPAAPFLLAGYIATGVATIAGAFAKVKSIMKQAGASTPDVAGGGGGGSTPVNTNPTLVRNGFVQTFAGTQPTQKVEIAPVKAYVVETESRATTNRIDQLERRRTL